MKGSIRAKERNLLGRIAEIYSRDGCIQIWHELMSGERLRAPRNKADGGFWEKYNHRKYVIEAFVEEFQKKNSDLEKIVKLGEIKYHIHTYPEVGDFRGAKLSGLFSKYYGSSPLEAFIEAGFTNPKSENYDRALTEVPWLVLGQLPIGYWQRNKGNVAKAVTWLLEVLNKSPQELQAEDFKSYSLHGLLQANGFSVLKILQRAGYKIKGEDMVNAPKRYWRIKAHVAQAVDDVLEATGKKSEQLILRDFEDCGYSGLLRHHRHSTIRLLRAMYGPDVKFNLRHTPHTTAGKALL